MCNLRCSTNIPSWSFAFGWMSLFHFISVRFIGGMRNYTSMVTTRYDHRVFRLKDRPYPRSRKTEHSTTFPVAWSTEALTCPTIVPRWLPADFLLLPLLVSSFLPPSAGKPINPLPTFLKDALKRTASFPFWGLPYPNTFSTLLRFPSSFLAAASDRRALTTVSMAFWASCWLTWAILSRVCVCTFVFVYVFVEGERWYNAPGTCREGWNAETKQPQAPNNRRRTANAKQDADGINVLRFRVVAVVDGWFRLSSVIVVCLVSISIFLSVCCQGRWIRIGVTRQSSRWNRRCRWNRSQVIISLKKGKKGISILFFGILEWTPPWFSRNLVPQSRGNVQLVTRPEPLGVGIWGRHFQKPQNIPSNRTVD